MTVNSCFAGMKEPVKDAENQIRLQFLMQDWSFRKLSGSFQSFYDKLRLSNIAEVYKSGLRCRVCRVCCHHMPSMLIFS